MKKINLLFAGTFTLLGVCIYMLISFIKKDATDIRVVETDSAFSFDALYDPGKSASVTRYIDSAFAPVKLGYQNDELDTDIVMPDQSRFEIRAEQGRMMVYLKKARVSDSLLSKMRIVFGKNFGSALAN